MFLKRSLSLLFDICVIFVPAINAFQYPTAAIGAALVVIPWYKSPRGVVSAVDLLHKLHWVNKKSDGSKPN